MARLLVFGYGLTAYSIFFVTYLYAAGFVGNLVVPKSLDSTPTAPFGTALLINLGLLTLFAIQHSVMARPGSSASAPRRAARGRAQHLRARQQPGAHPALLAVASARRRGLGRPGLGPAGRCMYAAFAFGWLLVLATTFLINHFDLFGLRQVWLHLRGREYGRFPSSRPALTGWCAIRSMSDGCSPSGRRRP